MSTRVKLSDIAKECKVSNGTVSLALNNSPLVNNDTKRLIKKTADRMGYIPNEMARSLVKKHSGKIGVVVPDIINSFYATFVSELSREIRSRGYTLAIYISDNDTDAESSAVDEMLANNVEGIIIVPVNKGNASPAYFERLSQHKVPYIFAVDRYSGIDGICVSSDCKAGMYAMVKHLIEKGYKDIAYLSGDLSVPTLSSRYEGYLKAIKESDIEERLILVSSIDYDGARKACLDCISTLPRAFVCPNDMMALGVINTLREQGIAVPELCAVTGFDGTIFSQISSVEITTVRQDIKQIAQKSSRLITDLINGAELKKTDELISTELLIKKSC